MHATTQPVSGTGLAPQPGHPTWPHSSVKVRRYESPTMNDDNHNRDDSYQIDIPPSFMALYLDAGRQKPNATREVIAARYELCEDLANLLTETAKNMFFSLGITERDVLERCHRGLIGEGAVVNEAEAQWVIRRLAELLEW